MNLARSTAVGANQVFKEKYRQVIKEIVEPIIRDIERMQQGLVRTDIDTTLAGYIAMGMAEYAAGLVHQGKYPEQEALDRLNLILQ